MNDPALPSSLLSELRGLTRRVAALERTPSLVAVNLRGFPWRESTVVTQSTTSGTFTALWSAHLPKVGADALSSVWVIGVNAADTAQCKVVVNGTESDTVTLAGSTATSWTVTLAWAHGLTRGAGPYDVEVQVRRSAGTAAAVTCGEPSVMVERDSNAVSATSGGLTAA